MGNEYLDLKKSVGSYVLIERLEFESLNKDFYGEDVLTGKAKYISSKSEIYPEQNKVLYFEKDIVGEVKLDGIFYDVVFYYNVIINFRREMYIEKESFKSLETI